MTSPVRPLRPAALRLLAVLPALLCLTPAPAAASSIRHRPLHERVAKADLIALVQRVSPPPPGAVAEEEYDVRTVDYRVLRVVKTTQGVQAGDTIPLGTVPRPQDCSDCIVPRLGQDTQSHPDAAYLAFLTWNPMRRAYRPGVYAPRHVPGPGPDVRHPAATGDTWLVQEGWRRRGFCAPEVLPLTYADAFGALDCTGEGYGDLEVWFTLEDFMAVGWHALTRASYPVAHIRPCAPPYVQPGVPLGVVAVRNTPGPPLKLPTDGLQACWQAHLLRHPELDAGTHVEALVVRGGEVFFPQSPVRELGRELTHCLRRHLLGRTVRPAQEGERRYRLELEFSHAPRWGVEPNPHFRGVP